MNTLKNKDIVANWLKNKNTLYTITVTYKANMSQRKAIEYLNKLHRMINNEYFNNIKKKEFIDMTAIRHTRTDKSTHFHVLVHDHEVFKAKRNINKDFESVVRDKRSKIKATNKYKEYNPIGEIYFQDYYEGNLERYLVRGLEIRPGNFDFIGISNYDGFMFGSIDNIVSQTMFRH